MVNIRKRKSIDKNFRDIRLKYVNKENIGYNKTNSDQHNANDQYNRNICTDTTLLQ